MLNRRALRRQLDHALRTDADLDAFCLDYFPEVFKRFGAQMERTQKVNLLLQLVPDYGQILHYLQPPPASHGGLALPPWAMAPVRGTGAVLLLALVAWLWPRLLPDRVERHDAAQSPRLQESTSKAAPTDPVLTMALIRGGDFLMGSSAEDIKAAEALCRTYGDTCPESLFAAEQPQRAVSLRSFYLDRTEVTNTEFAAWLDPQLALPAQRRSAHFVAEKSRLTLGTNAVVDVSGTLHGLILEATAQGIRVATRPGWSSRPVVQISWEMAQRYCAAHGKRLPTEAEWEYAARSTSRRTFPWGNTAPSCAGVAFGRSPRGLCQTADHTAPVASLPLDVSPAPEQVHDLGGNVAEWVMDWYLPTYPSCETPCQNPAVIAPALTLPARVVRGGDAHGRAVDTRAARRAWLPPGDAKSNVGFRCAMDAPAR